jgi:hypothetical protein
VIVAAAEHEETVRQVLEACRDPAGVAVTVRVLDAEAPDSTTKSKSSKLPSPSTSVEEKK